MHQGLIAVARLVVATGTFLALLRWRKRPDATKHREHGLNYIPEPDLYPPLSSDPLLVEAERFLDTDEDPDTGSCSYHYSGMSFQFRHGNRLAAGRYYDDTPDEFSIYLEPPPDQFHNARYTEPPYRDPLLAEIVDYLRTHEPQRHKLMMLCKGGYVSIAQDKVGQASSLSDDVERQLGISDQVKNAKSPGSL